MNIKEFLLIALMSILFISCSDNTGAGATGVGNPTEVAIVAATGEVTGQGGFDSTGTRSSVEPAKVIFDEDRAFTLSAIAITVDSFSWQIQTETLEDEIDPKLTFKDEKLYYYGPVVFDALNPEPLNLHLPTAGYKAVRFFIGKDEEDTEEEKATEPTITIKGTYTNDDEKLVPFTFEMPYGIELKFMKKGKPYYWERGSDTRLDLLLDLDDWFAGLDILELINVSGSATSEVKATITTNAIRMNIKNSGVLSIYEK